jgi:hypothetical protein
MSGLPDYKVLAKRVNTIKFKEKFSGNANIHKTMTTIVSEYKKA